MSNFFKLTLFVFFSFVNLLAANCQDSQRIEEYVKSLREKGTEPVQFVLNVLDTHDLILFDDANHSTAEPFKFYQKLVNDTSFQNKVRYIFIEAFSISKQDNIDLYLNSEIENKTLLYPVFQDDFSGTGWN